MKKIITAMLILTCMAGTATAKGGKNKGHKQQKGCPAATCTDHSYDQAYTAPQSHAKKDCPASSCTDHSYDEAYSAGWTSPAPVNTTTSGISNNPLMVDRVYGTPLVNTRYGSENPNAYSLNNYTFYGRTTTGVNRPSAYEGDDAPTYDGFEKNVYRNMRYLNSSEQLPSNNGQ